VLRSGDRRLANPGIVRDRLNTVKGASVKTDNVLDVVTAFSSFDEYLWRFVGGAPIKNRFDSQAEVLARTPESDAMSKDLKKRGVKFVGSTLCDALMQATGMVNDHTTVRFRWNLV
jgi:DNA-3-methyladenine glycosylase I